MSHGRHLIRIWQARQCRPSGRFARFKPRWCFHGRHFVGWHVVLIGPLNVTNAKMAHADFSDAEFEKVNFSRSEFMLSKWDNANSFQCDFRGASFWGVNFKNTHFLLCDFGCDGQGKNLRPTDFCGQFQSDEVSRFYICNFSGAGIPLVVWNSVHFESCNFAYAQIGRAHV